MADNPLKFVRDNANAHHAEPIDVASDFATFDVTPPMVSGRPATTFRVRVEPAGDSVRVREERPTLLPSVCPERHISHDGSFCLYWPEMEPITTLETAGAEAWWRKLLVFLKRQQTASAQRRWPGRSDARAHGPEAARNQMVAEKAASELGPQFRCLLDEARLSSVRRKAGGEPRLRLLLDGRRLMTVKEQSLRLMTRRSRCKCDHADDLRLPICACGNHEEALKDLTIALQRWRKAESDFFQAYRVQGVKCCGTLDDCPLAA
ncbi:hypothetical protein ACH79_38235 [Bradyrhizobium sp. CCBAU 051011]|uniref:E2 domain-associated cysteine-rich protein n=1 Tax=Bradyrhizobium sp. CCBAU 051011 TaxID=858422 RepID=UPI0013742A73|nr:E2 domain-associated cysteine-rich protein [Bradyrhizobium sp. CCBAU 051011]QHO77616.1 hypothetical protein ACH79_38235 [Bradyrhizobium sp. CCBAU 051011]